DLFDRLDDVPAVRVSADGIDLAAEATVVVRVLLVLEIRQDDLEAVARAPDRVGPGCVRTDEDEGRRADAVLVRAVTPDLERMDAESAVDLTAGRGLAMELIDPAAVVELARELLLDLLEPAPPFDLELVPRRLRVRVPRLPEPLDEGVALVVLLERQEGLLLRLGDQEQDVFQKLAILRSESRGVRRGGRTGTEEEDGNGQGRGQPGDSRGHGGGG